MFTCPYQTDALGLKPLYAFASGHIQTQFRKRHVSYRLLDGGSSRKLINSLQNAPS
jgi:hypothetical protein